MRGNPAAPVTVIEFSDFRCPYCRRVQPALAKLLAEYPGEVRIVYLHFPVVAPDSGRAAVAAVVAGWHGRFWEMHDALFSLQGVPLTEDNVLAEAARIGLDADLFRQELRDPEALARVQADAATARGLGLRGTPAFFVNGRPFPGAQPYSALADAVAKELGR